MDVLQIVMPHSSSLQVLVLSRVQLDNAQTVVDHVFCFQEFSRHDIFVVPWVGSLPPELDINRFDVIVFHYTFVPFLESHLSGNDRERIIAFQGLKVGFRQDEYTEIYRYHTAMRELGYDLFYTCVPEPYIRRVYPEGAVPGVAIKNTLTGFVPASFLTYPRSPIANRTVHVGYRCRLAPYYLGDLVHEKSQIADMFTAACKFARIACDVSAREGERLYGQKWADFLANCRCMLGTESGASVLDFDGSLDAQWAELTGSPWTSENVSVFSYSEYRDRYLHGRQSHGLMNQISPRAFEAAALGTALVLFEGRYSGILEPDRHYIPVSKDGSNMDDVLAKIRDPLLLQEMADRTYQEIACNSAYSYGSFVASFDDDIAHFHEKKRGHRAARQYSREEFSEVMRRNGYIDAHQFVANEAAGIHSFSRPFDLDLLPYERRREECSRRFYFRLAGILRRSRCLAEECLGRVRRSLRGKRV